jgi:hypothetical protein
MIARWKINFFKHTETDNPGPPSDPAISMDIRQSHSVHDQGQGMIAIFKCFQFRNRDGGAIYTTVLDRYIILFPVLCYRKSEPEIATGQYI